MTDYEFIGLLEEMRKEGWYLSLFAKEDGYMAGFATEDMACADEWLEAESPTLVMAVTFAAQKVRAQVKKGLGVVRVLERLISAKERYHVSDCSSQECYRGVTPNCSFRTVCDQFLPEGEGGVNK